jgi:hypothetical protein
MMINHKFSGVALAIMLVFGILSPLSAQTDSTLSPAGQSTIDGRIWLAFAGPRSMRILALAPFPEEARQRLERTVSVVSSWPTIRVTEIRAESSKGVDDYVLTFPSIQYEGREYSANVPGGLRLRFDGALMYDFRVRSGDYFVRVRGVLMDEASLLAEIAKAVQDPGAYIAERDPSWLALRIEQLDKIDLQMDRRLDQLDSRTVEINRRLTQRADENAAKTMENAAKIMENAAKIMENEKLIQTKASQGEALIEARSAEFSALLETITTDFGIRLDAVQKVAAEDRRTLEASIQANQALSELLRMALAAEMNRGFFGKSRPLDAVVLDQVKAFKASNPDADRVAALEYAKAGELKPRAKEIDIIFKLWFDE